jgi:hypothetical protein
MCFGFSISGCAAVSGMEKVQSDIWMRLERGETVNLVVTLDDSEIRKLGAERNAVKGILFDDPDTLRFKAARYAALKRVVLSHIPTDQVQIVRDYDSLPTILLCFRSPTALKSLLSNPSVLRTDEDKGNSLINGTQ